MDSSFSESDSDARSSPISLEVWNPNSDDDHPLSDTPSTSTRNSQVGKPTKVGQSKAATIKVDKDDLRAKTHFIKTYVANGKLYRTWECGLCSKEFKYQYTLLRHIPTHTDVRNFHCNMCSKSFRQMSTLAQHKATHWDARPFCCDLCDKSFNRVSTLISHKKIHTDEKKHICPYCGKGFHQKGNLKNHKYTHTNERPYKCDECGKGFNQKSNLVVHKNSSHSKKDDTCEECNISFVNSLVYRNHMQFAHKALVTKPVNKTEPKSASDPMPMSRPASTRSSASIKESVERVPKIPARSNDVTFSGQLKISSDQKLAFIKQKPTIEMWKVLAKNEVPFVLYFQHGSTVPAICKVVIDGDHYALMNPSGLDLSKYKSNGSNVTTEIPFVCMITEQMCKGVIEYVVKPFTDSPAELQQLPEENEKKNILGSSCNIKAESTSSEALTDDTKNNLNLFSTSSVLELPKIPQPTTEENTDLFLPEDDTLIPFFTHPNTYPDQENLPIDVNSFLEYLYSGTAEGLLLFDPLNSENIVDLRNSDPICRS